VLFTDITLGFAKPNVVLVAVVLISGSAVGGKFRCCEILIQQ
jgi:hypothetical protein